MFSDSEFIEIMFLMYKLNKENIISPENLIKSYFKYEDKSSFEDIVESFKRKYIYNENEMENVHNKKERLGLSAVYDYISKNIDNCPNIYVILVIHSILYSKVPYKNFGGSFRNSMVVIKDSDVNTCEYKNISKEIALLYNEYSDILELKDKVNEANDVDLLILYIDKVIELKCRLIEIHPFIDGNGRTFRAFVNFLLKKVNLPFIYVTKKEKSIYIEAMDEAIRLKDFNKIKKFYYNKICHSIYELDIKEKIKSKQI